MHARFTSEESSPCEGDFLQLDQIIVGHLASEFCTCCAGQESMEEYLLKEVPARAGDGYLHSFLPAVHRSVSFAYTHTSKTPDIYQESPMASITVDCLILVF